MRAPRFFACSYSSSTSTPAPSDSTKPSRSRSHGRLAFSGSSLRVVIARAEQNPPIATPVVVYSAPPATITSASPYWIMRIQAEIVRRGGARGDAGDVRTFQPQHDREVSRRHVDDRARH